MDVVYVYTYTHIYVYVYIHTEQGTASPSRRVSAAGVLPEHDSNKGCRQRGEMEISGPADLRRPRPAHDVDATATDSCKVGAIAGTNDCDLATKTHTHIANFKLRSGHILRVSCGAKTAKREKT